MSLKGLLYRVYDFFTFKQLKYLRYFLKTDRLDAKQIKELQFQKIRECCKVHYGITINSWNEFYQLSITSKRDLPEVPSGKGLKFHETSGSTGEPRKVCVPADTWYRKDAIFTRSWLKMGLGSGKVLRLIAGEPQYKFYDWLRNVYPMNYRNISDEQAEWLIANKPKIIHGPGGAVRQLCELVIQKGHGSVLSGVTINWAGESSHNHKERLLQYVTAFNDHYGLAELPTVAASDSEDNMKVIGEQAYVEIVDSEGAPVPDGVEGYILVTDFNNHVTPIIRYKSGDRAKKRHHVDASGLSYDVLYDLIGRGVDYYDGPEVKRAIGWWVVSPISHTLGHIIDQWRVEIAPRESELILHYKGEAEESHPDFANYALWVEENIGLSTKIKKSDEKVNYSIYWKNKLVRVRT